MLKLTRPLVCFDLETTGINPVTDRIWQVGLVKVYPDGTEKEWESFVNPGIPIPPEVAEATKNERFPNGITNEFLKDKPPFSAVAPVLAQGFGDCDLAGYNSRGFDGPLLQAEFQRCGIIIDLSKPFHVDGFKLYSKVRPRNLADFIETMTGEDFASKAHDALEDAKGTWRAIKAALEKYPALPQTPESLHEYLFGQDGINLAGGAFYFLHDEVIVNFGKKWKGIPLKKVPKDYMDWCCRPEQTFDPEIKRILRDASKGVFPVRKR